MSNKTYCIMVDVEVTDEAELRQYALCRASQAGVSFEEFGHLETDEPDKIAFYLGWAFDSGTPKDSGFQIEQSNVEGADLSDPSWGGR